MADLKDFLTVKALIEHLKTKPGSAMVVVETPYGTVNAIKDINVVNVQPDGGGASFNAVALNAKTTIGQPHREAEIVL